MYNILLTEINLRSEALSWKLAGSLVLEIVASGASKQRRSLEARVTVTMTGRSSYLEWERIVSCQASLLREGTWIMANSKKDTYGNLDHIKSSEPASRTDADPEKYSQVDCISEPRLILCPFPYDIPLDCANIKPDSLSLLVDVGNNARPFQSCASDNHLDLDIAVVG